MIFCLLHVSRMSENVDEALLHQYKHETSHSATENHEMTSYPQLFPN